MVSKLYTVIFLGSLIGSTLCVIPSGEIQIGPLFGAGGRIFGGNKHFEAVFQKGADLKPLLVKKAIIGAGALGAGALAVGGAALLAKKFPHLGHGWGWGNTQGYGHGHGHGHYNNYNQVSSGWNSNNYNGGYYQSASATTDVKFPASTYPTSASYNNYPSTEYGYPQQSQNEWQGSDSYSSGGGSFGWSG